MAVLADVGRRDMRRVFAGRVGAIVAANAIARDVGVIKICREPGDRCMAIVAVVAACDVCRVLARSCIAVVACIAAAKHLRVIDGEYR